MIVNLALAPFDINFNVPCGISWWCAGCHYASYMHCLYSREWSDFGGFFLRLLILFIYCCIAVEPEGLSWDSGVLWMWVCTWVCAQWCPCFSLGFGYAACLYNVLDACLVFFGGGECFWSWNVNMLPVEVAVGDAAFWSAWKCCLCWQVQTGGEGGLGQRWA